MCHRIAIFLAGGDGNSPRQFPALTGTETLLARTIDRVAGATGDSPRYCIGNRTQQRLYQGGERRPRLQLD